MAHIIVVGAGVGGVPCAYELRKKLGKTHRVSLVGSSPYVEFTPSSPWIAVGWRKCEKTRADMREPLGSKDIEWHGEPVTSIDPARNSLRQRSGAELAYEYLVIATGPKLAFEEVPGLGPAGFTRSVCTHERSQAAWEKYQEFLKNRVHLAKIAFEKHFLRKVRTGSTTPVFEKYVLRLLGIGVLKAKRS